MTELDELLAEESRLLKEYDAAKKGYESDKSNGNARLRWNAAQNALRDARRHWRTIGETVGTREPNGVNVQNNTEG